jgi:SAM-dependent methyltransferase
MIKMTHSPKEYWRGIAVDFGSADAIGFGPVLHPNTPSWFNEQIDRVQFRAVGRAFRIAQIASGATVPEIGCGPGRWVRRFQLLGLKATFLDATQEMLRLALQRGINACLLGTEAYRLPLGDQASGCVADIIIVQHITSELQPAAIGEMLRVLRPSMSRVLMELIRDRDSHIFPREPKDWIRQATTRGAHLIDWFGQDYLILDRAFVSLAPALPAPARNAAAGAQRASPGAASGPPPAARRIFWGVRRVAVPVSARMDPIAAKLCSSAFVTHGLFVFRK